MFILRALDLSCISATATGIHNFIKQIPNLPYLESLNLSGNPMTYFCIDALLNVFKTY